MLILGYAAFANEYLFRPILKTSGIYRSGISRAAVN
jgi:hypothetical protein